MSGADSNAVLVAPGTSADTVAAQRPAVDVAVGVLIERDAQGQEGRFLLTSRPEGKVYAGYWEFPGGKLEAGETVHDALARELHEELGITIGDSVAWHELVMDYPHARVRLHFRKVFTWTGEFQMREGQRMAWETLPARSEPVLPGTVPVLRWLAEERKKHFVTLPDMDWLDHIRWDKDGLVPVIAQEASTGDVLMFAWMNREALAKTAEVGQAVYYSRSRRKLWHKGEESGHFQVVHEIRLDCDQDVVLLKITQQGHEPGIACHTGRHSCFFERLEGGQWVAVDPVLKDPGTIYR